MKLRLNNYLLVLLVICCAATAQSRTYVITADSILSHIRVLAADSLEGREVGEDGELKAAHYIASVFDRAGLEPGGDGNTFLQEFEFTKRVEIGPSTHLNIDGVELTLHEEFAPLRQSASTEFDFSRVISAGYGITLKDGSHDDYKGLDVDGKAVIIKRFAPETGDSGEVRFDRHTAITEKVARAMEAGAAGVFLYTPEGHDDTLIFRGGPVHVTPKDIPVIWLRRAGLERLGLSLDSVEINSAAGRTELLPIRDTAFNVAGSVSSDNDTLVIIGAHYDHLGWGEMGSFYRDGPPMIHPGADDNASGVAALLELARWLVSERNRLKYSYSLVAFTGEEAGLLGSSHFARSLDVDSSLVRMMINMDMIGRLSEQENGLAVFGTGTCEEFKTYFDSVEYPRLKITTKQSGIGPSDHTPFYSLGIPVVHLFTGAHEDYHTPRDVIEKIDADGIVMVTDFLGATLLHFDRLDSKLTFQRTRSTRPGSGRSSFTVTLGIMPDHVAEVRGLRVGAVSVGGSAEKAGLLKGDVIIKMGPRTIDDIYTYMNALGKYRKGDTTTVVVERGADTLSVLVEF
ncbi:MAG: M20/M25/M40 family metallo-hydrolase [Candidatus Zixiibacteriota bacterium]|nr:MAG: M20/M25/M40 family metallo-hydrolase [candidate division Zixibacteria bacterium]